MKEGLFYFEHFDCMHHHVRTAPENLNVLPIAQNYVRPMIEAVAGEDADPSLASASLTGAKYG